MACFLILSYMYISIVCQSILAYNTSGDTLQQIQTISGMDINLVCPTSEQTENVTWLRQDDSKVFATCSRANCEISADFQDESFIAQRNLTSSSLMITASSNGTYQCIADMAEHEVIIKTFQLRVVEFSTPICRISPSTSVDGIFGIDLELTCEWDTPSGIAGELELVGEGISAAPSRFRSIRHIMTIANVLKRQFPSCKATVLDTNESRSCSFPLYIDVESDFDINDAAFVCDVKDDIDHPTFRWKLVDIKDGFVDIDTRSRTLYGGRVLFLKGLTMVDDNRMMACAVSSKSSSSEIDAIGFARITVDHEPDDDMEDVAVKMEPVVIGSIIGLIGLAIVIGLVCAISCCMLRMRSTLRNIHNMVTSISRDNKTIQPVASKKPSLASLAFEKAGVNYSVPRQIRYVEEKAVIGGQNSKTKVEHNDGYIYMGGDPDDIDYEDMGCVECD